MGYGTPRELIESLKNFYKEDLDQPLAWYLHSRQDIWEGYGDSLCEEYGYQEETDLPKELVEAVCEGLFEGDSIWEGLRDSEQWEVTNWLKENNVPSLTEQQKIIEEEAELWDTEGKTNTITNSVKEN